MDWKTNTEYCLIKAKLFKRRRNKYKLLCVNALINIQIETII